MPLYLDTRGNSTLGIGICARCSEKKALHELFVDPNTLLRVCREDLDTLDPYRLPARKSDNLVLPFCRPDTSLSIRYSGGVNVLLPTVKIFGIDQINAATPWQPNTNYQTGDSITPLNVDLETTPLPQNWWLAILGGTSGPVAPNWPSEAGVVLGDFTYLTSDAPDFLQLLSDNGLVLFKDGNGDGTVTWLNLSLYPI